MKLKHFVLIVILGFCCQTHGQGLEKSTEIDSLFSLVIKHRVRSPDSSLEAAKHLLPLLEGIERNDQLADLYWNMSTAYFYKNEYLNVIDYGIKSIDIFRKLGDSLRVADNYTTLSSAYKYLGHRKEALEYNLRSVELMKQYGKPTDYATSLYALGNYYMETKEYDKCETYYLEALTILEGADSPGKLADMYFNMGVLSAVKKRIDESSGFYEKSLGLYQALGDEASYPKVWTAIGYNFYVQGKFTKAKSYYLKAEQGLSISSSTYSYCYNLASLSRTEYMLKNYGSALNYAKKMERVASDVGVLRFSIDAQVLFRQVYDAQGDLPKAYASLQLFHILSDSLQNIEKEKVVKELTIKYETELKEKEIAKLTSETKAQEQEVLLATSEKNAYRVGIVLAVALAIAVSAFFAQRQKASQLRSMQALTERNVRIDALLKEQEVSSLNALIEGQEKERMRIAEELHDRLGSMLSAIKLNFISSTVKKDVEQKSPENETVKTTQMLDEAVTEVRRISHNLSTGQVSRYGLVSSMDDLAARINQSDSVAMKVMHFNLEERLPVEMETGIYRITQEMLANVLKHAHASEFIVQLNKTENSVILTAEDDGIGFDYKEARRRGGIGLQNIENRVKKFGGQFSVDTAPGKGAILTFEFPLEA
ncbi:sensor histidine kinase [Imperialibacter roseus]|uniref:Sensor histidine kinase n=2 Tax=Imperialibacter roseus TaxID=1324217 RepID=A0ABZ0IUD6_9BACT|nr:sensor histidine kinase [Imperialibacter roseus]WOK08658.1 sensor histidine kinase [Imperialibacter roseus]